MSASKNRDVVEAFEQAFTRRIEENCDDNSLAVIADQVLKEVKISMPPNEMRDFKDIEAGLSAIRLWEKLPENQAYPLTRDILWSAIVRAWTSRDSEESIGFRHFIASAEKPSDSKVAELMLARLRESVDRLQPHIAFEKITDFLTERESKRDFDEFTVGAIGRMLGRYATTANSIFGAHVLRSIHRLTYDAEWDFQEHMAALNLAIPYVTKVSTKAVEIGYRAAQILDQLELPGKPVLKLGHEALEFVDIVWERADTSENVGFGKAEDDERTKFLDDQGEVIRKWYKKNPRVSAVPFRLIMNTTKVSGPTKGAVSLIIRMA